MNPVDARKSGRGFAEIRRMLHQTWKNHDLPHGWVAFRQSWLDRHPEWEHRLWTDEDIRRLVVESYPQLLPIFDAFPRDIQRVDMAKFLILHRHGGVYADLDTECLRPVDDLLGGGGMTLSRTRDGVIEGAFMAAPPEHPFCAAAIRRMCNPRRAARFFMRIPGLQATGVLLSTGPLMLHREYRDFARLACRDDDGCRVLDPRYCSSRSWWRRHQGFRPDPKTFILHHHSDSWLLPVERSVVRFANPQGVVFVVALVLALLAVGGWWGQS